MIDRLLTLTYGPPFCTDPGQLRCDVAAFIRRLRAHLGHRFPYVWVPELHKDGERFHAHIGLAEYIAKDLLAEKWGHGFVDIRLLRGRRTMTDVERATRTAGYLSKYIGKAFEQSDVFGRHRYEVGQGFQPETDRQRFDTVAEAYAWITQRMGGGVPEYVFRSSSVDDWPGPTTLVTFWA